MTKIADLTISDEIWGMLDPGAQLPRDPITVHLDTAGKIKLNADLLAFLRHGGNETALP